MRPICAVAGLLLLVCAGCPPKKDPDTPRRQSNANEQPYVAPRGQGAAVEADLRQGKTLVKSGQWRAALKAFEAVAKKYPKDSRPHYYVGVCLINLKQAKAAIAAYRRGVKRRPHFFELWNNLGTALLVARKPGQAVRPLEHAVKLQPKDYSGWLNLGLAYEGAGKLPKAARALERAAEIMPTNANTHLALADVLRKLGRHAAALKRYDETVRRRPRDVYAHLGAVMMLTRLNREADALARLAKAGTGPRIFAVRGMVLMHFKRWAKAEAAFINAYKGKPAHPGYVLMIGRARLAGKRYRQAVVSFKLAQKIAKGRLHSANFYLAEAYRKQGKCRLAKPLYRKFMNAVKTGKRATEAAAHLKRCRR